MTAWWEDQATTLMLFKIQQTGYGKLKRRNRYDIQPVSYTPSSNVENLTLTCPSAINGTGNALIMLSGSSGKHADRRGNDMIAAALTDTMVGGTGNDTCRGRHWRCGDGMPTKAPIRQSSTHLHLGIQR